MRGGLLIAVLVLLLAGCGSTQQATPTPSPARTAAPRPTPSAADVQRIDVLATSVSTWQLVAVPVATIRSASTQSVASNVLVHLTPTRGGRPLTPLVTPALTLYPGQTLVVAATCTDTCIGADGATATVTPGSWAPASGSPLSATAGAVTCTVSCQGHGQWDVPLTVGSPALVANEQVDLFAACTDAGGAVVGGGQRTLLWPQSGGNLQLHIPVIVNAAPAACQVGATVSD